MTAAADLQLILPGTWEVHTTRTGLLGTERFRRRPSRHVVVSATGWELYEGAGTRRLARAGRSRGTWQVVDVDGRPLLVLTVASYRPSAAAGAAVESNYGYTGGAAVVIAARAVHEAEARRMRDGEARMYLLPVHLAPDEMVMALACDGRYTPRERWIRVADPRLAAVLP